VLGNQIVIEKNRVIAASLQQFPGFGDIVDNVEVISLEALHEPLTTPLVILKQKDANGMAFRVRTRQSQFVQQSSDKAHKS